MGSRLWILALGAFALVGCGERQDKEPAAAADAKREMPGMGMDSMQMGAGHMSMEGMGMMPMMRAHMDSMMRMSAEQLSQMMAMHERMMSQMLDRMGSDLRGMNMTGSAEWNALGDSVKQDLAELPGLRDQALAARMQAHADRVRRLLAMHETMTKQ
jgi:hypothetical protein